jgi:hypothetical protein
LESAVIAPVYFIHERCCDIQNYLYFECEDHWIGIANGWLSLGEQIITKSNLETISVESRAILPVRGCFHLILIGRGNAACKLEDFLTWSGVLNNRWEKHTEQNMPT